MSSWAAGGAGGPFWASAVLAAAPEEAEAGPTALLIVVLLGIGVVFLARSMIKHLKRVPPSFDEPLDEAPPDETDTGTPPA